MTTSTSATPRAWLIIGLAFLLCLVNYLDRVVISFAIEPIKEFFKLNNTQFGLAISLFALGALAINGLSGWLLDRFGTRLIWTLGLIIWSAAMAVLGLTSLWLMFLIMRVVLGIGEGVNFPAMNRAVADWLPPRLAGRGVGLMVLGVPAALLLGGPLLSHLIEWIDWRWAFVTLAIGSLIIGCLLPMVYRHPPRRVAPNNHAHTSPWTLLKNPTLLATSWSFFAFGYVLWFGITWIPGYFQHTYDVKLTTIGWLSTLPWGISCLLIPLIGWWSDRRFIRTGKIRSARIHLIWPFQFAGAMCFVPLAFIESQTAAVILLGTGIGLSMAANAPYYSICTDLFPAQAATATGLMVTFFSISGLISPVLTGWLTDAFGGYDAAFVTMAGVVISGAIGLMLFARPREDLTAPT